MKLTHLLLSICCLLPLASLAQHGNAPSRTLNGLLNDSRFDHAHTSVYDTIILNTYGFQPDDVPTYDARTITDRLNSIPSDIPMDYNEHVQRHIDRFTVNSRPEVSKLLGLQKVYFPIFEEELLKRNMPIELKYLTIVESALNPHAQSYKGAMGLWQFMPLTAKEYGLNINGYIDERKDPRKATVAAIDYLETMNEKFGDWLLAIASYNCGPGNVRKAIRRSGGKKTFWEVYKYLPRETRGYVPAFIAATYTFQYASAHNLYPIYVDLDLRADTIHISKLSISLDEIAKISGADADELYHMNPELEKGIVPYSKDAYVLRVPYSVAAYFVINRDQIQQKYSGRTNAKVAAKASKVYASRRINTKGYIASSKSSKPKSSSSSSSRTKSYTSSSKSSSQTNAKPSSSSSNTFISDTYFYHTVKSGEDLSAIGKNYAILPSRIIEANQLSDFTIEAGQKLKIYTKDLNSLDIAAENDSRKPQSSRMSVSAQYHTVRKGETLWEIVKLYGISMSEVKALNPSLNPDRITINQKIRVK